jgi:TonB-dependent receptor
MLPRLGIHRKQSHRYLLLTAIATAIAVPAQVARAEGESNAPSVRAVSALEEVVVMAQRTTAQVARDAQLQAPNLIDLTTATEIARLPDVNTGEAVRRIPGISLETDTGEGRYVNIRGLDADLNSTTFGGLRLPPTNTSSPSGAGRAVAFDSIPIGFIGAITVTKSNLPEQDAEALGGTIDITPKTAPPDGRPFMEFELGGGEELQRHTGISDLAFTTGARFGGDGANKPFSILLTGSLYNDGRGIDDAEAGFFDEQSAGVPDKAFASFEQRWYQYHRRRHGYGIDLGYDPDASNHFFVRYYDAGYTEHKYRQLLQWNFQDPNAANGAPCTLPGAPAPCIATDSANPAGFVAAIDSIRTTVQYEEETLTQRVAEVGGKNRIGDSTLDYHVGYTKGSYHQPYNYNYRFENQATLNSATYDNTTNANWPTIAISSPPGFNVLDPQNYQLTKATGGSQTIDDHEWGIGANLTIPTHLTDHADEQWKFGVNARLREKTGDQPSYELTLPATPYLMSAAAAGNPITYYRSNYAIPPLVDPGTMLAFWNANSAGVTTDPIGNQLSVVNDKENVYAAYGQYQFGFGKLGVVAGVRVENTRATYSAYEQDLTGLTCPAASVCPVSTNRNYTNVFPSAQARYEFDPDLIGRIALSTTLARPGFQQITAATTVDSNGNVTAGNPNLRPTKATSLDLSLERYLPYAGIASVGAFAKYITDYIVTNAVPLNYQVSGGNLGVARLFSFTNGSPTRLYGVEANFVKKFKDEWPGLLGGFGVSANWTWVASAYSVPIVDSNTNLVSGTRRSILPSTSRNTGNAELLYDMYGLHLSLGAYYTSRNVFTQGPSAATDIWTQDRLSLDFGAQYEISEPVSVYLNFKNLTNTALKFTDGIDENRVIQREFYGTTLQAGVNVKF